jgi:hypothetical protein
VVELGRQHRAELLKMPEGHYSPAKIHSRLDLGDDGWLYCSTHRGSTRVTSDQYHYQGDWIVRCHPESGKSEIVVRAPVEKHCIPTSVLDPQRLIFYGGTAPGDQAPEQGIQFFAYDCAKGKLLYAGPEGPARYLIFARSTGKAYYVAGKNEGGDLMRFDPEVGKPVKIEGTIGLRAATQETPQGIVYTASSGQKQDDATLYAFDTKTEKIEVLGPSSVGSQAYIASMDADPSGRYLYYVPGAHGGGERDNSAVVQGHRLPAPVLPGADRLHAQRNLQHGGRPEGRQALHHLERQPRQPSMGLLRADGDSYSGERAGGE